MHELDVVLRAGGGTLLVTVALLLLLNAPAERTFRLFLPLALGLSGFLAVNTPEIGLQLSGIPWAVTAALSGNAAVFLWWFCLAVFDDDFRLGRLELGVGAAWFTIFLADRGVLGPGFGAAGLSWLLIPFGSAMIAHLGWRIVRDRGGDLVESRRRARLAAVMTLAGLLAIDLAIDLLLGVDWKSQWFTLAQNAAIVLVAMGLAAWLLRPNPAVLTTRGAQGAPYVRSAGTVSHPAAPSAADERLVRRLDELTGVKRIYLDPDLTFAAFVEAMGAPEAAVRRLINQQLGYRHFRGFLNAYRVRAARRALVDPAKAGEKMTSIAFDAGFASLASFNRAFKLVEGRSPTASRATAQSEAEQRPVRTTSGLPEDARRLKPEF